MTPSIRPRLRRIQNGQHGGPGTAMSLHCAGVSNLFVQIYGQKKWVLISPRFTPFMYPAPTRGINWQSRVDFRDPDDTRCSLYRFVDRYETVLEPGDVCYGTLPLSGMA